MRNFEKQIKEKNTLEDPVNNVVAFAQ